MVVVFPVRWFVSFLCFVCWLVVVGLFFSFVDVVVCLFGFCCCCCFVCFIINLLLLWSLLFSFSSSSHSSSCF